MQTSKAATHLFYPRVLDERAYLGLNLDVANHYAQHSHILNIEAAHTHFKSYGHTEPRSFAIQNKPISDLEFEMVTLKSCERWADDADRFTSDNRRLLDHLLALSESDAKILQRDWYDDSDVPIRWIRNTSCTKMHQCIFFDRWIVQVPCASSSANRAGCEQAQCFQSFNKKIDLLWKFAQVDRGTLDGADETRGEFVELPFSKSSEMLKSLMTSTYLKELPAKPVDRLLQNNAMFHHQSPTLVIVDNFYKNVDHVREFALKQDFVEHPAQHKGRRTDARFMFPGLQQEFERLLDVSIQDWDTMGCNGVFQYCTKDDVIVFHSDLQQYAGIVFLTPDAPPSTGTSLLRSKQTGLRRSPTEEDARRTGKSTQQLSQETYAGKLLDPNAWELVDKVGNVYNRLVLWKGQYIHAASEYFGDTLENGRLFQLFFFNARPNKA